MTNPTPNNRRDLPADERRTVIPTPRSTTMFPGWGVRI
jgi:hypothetical protein